MKKKIFVGIVLLAALLSVFLIGTGFHKRTDVVLVDYTVSEDGTSISMGVLVPASMGYVRGFKDKGGGVKPHYLIFYSTFGGLNSCFGAENSFELEVSPEDTEIYFNRTGNGYELVLCKDESTGQWVRPEAEMVN